MARKLNPAPVSWPLGLACAVAVFALVWLASQPGFRLFDDRMLAVFGVWALCLALTGLVYRWRPRAGRWAHGAVAVCAWTRLLAELDDYRAQVIAPLGLAGLLDWAADVLPLLALAVLASLSLGLMTVLALRGRQEQR